MLYKAVCVSLCVWWNAFIEILIRFWCHVCECANVCMSFSNESVCLEFSKRSMRRQNHNSFVRWLVRSKFYAKKCCFVVRRLLYIFVVVVVRLSPFGRKRWKRMRKLASKEEQQGARAGERDQINSRQTIAPKWFSHDIFGAIKPHGIWNRTKQNVTSECENTWYYHVWNLKDIEHKCFD